MDFENVVRNRNSVRKYLPKRVEKKKIEKILELTNRAPSAGNLQAYRIFVIENKELIDSIAKNTGGMVRNFINNPPCLMVFCADPEASGHYKERGRTLYCIQDATIACAYAQLVAQSCGLVSCWVGSFDEDYVKKVLKIENLRPVSILALGYSDEDPTIKSRKKIGEICKIRF